jgi:hypothetical protein
MGDEPMKKLATLAGALALFSLSLSSAGAEDVMSKLKAEDTIGFYLHIYEKLVPEDRQGMDALMNGIGVGLMWANAMLQKRGQPQLYCQPSRLTLTGPILLDMIRRTLNEQPKWSEFPPGMVALLTLQRTFPCQK